MELNFANKILKDQFFQENLRKIETLEKDRIFCCHGIDHLLDTARIALIMCYEKGVKVDPDIIYCAGLLHDSGRGEEYIKGTPHHIASCEIGGKILERIGADENFSKQVLGLIKSHRTENNDNLLENIFYQADKKSRRCFMCKSADKCNWSNKSKNLILEV